MNDISLCLMAFSFRCPWECTFGVPGRDDKLASLAHLRCVALILLACPPPDNRFAFFHLFLLSDYPGYVLLCPLPPLPILFW